MIPSAYFSYPIVLVWAIPLLLWVLLWKAMALWKAAKNQQLGWFVLLFLVQTIGILDIIYILFFQDLSE